MSGPGVDEPDKKELAVQFKDKANELFKGEPSAVSTMLSS